MKKAIAFLMAVICLFSFAGCEEPTVTTEDHLAADKSFVFEELKITLTEAFDIAEEDKDSIWYESATGEISVSIDTSEIPVVEDTPVGLEEYATSFFTEGPYTPNGEIESKNGFFYAECEVKAIGFDFLYLIAFYESESSFYTAYFMCDFADYETYQPYIMKWAESVIITPKPAVA